jgi:diguanylate cyclase (GGDEF)-like protein
MNAAIEAAHAGDSGKGFAVVANEIRKLAESSSAQSKTIRGVLKNIKGSIDKITKSTEGVLGKFDAIESGVRTVATQEESVLGAMEEQGQGSKRILEAIGQVNTVTHHVKEAAMRMVESSKEAMHKTDKVESQAFTDELTGARNKQYFEDLAEQELRYCVGERRDFALVMVGVDGLSRINGTHGEEVGDEVLKIMTMSARNSLKQGTLMGRLDGDEFAIALPGVSRSTAAKLAEQLQRKMVDAPFATKGLKMNVTISLGVASKSGAAATLEGITAEAKRALARAKEAGGNKVIAEAA